MNQNEEQLEILNKKIIKCKKCPRLSSYIRNVAKLKVKRFTSDRYWGKPLPGFGDINAEILLIGLAPAAHGGNRTGRMFTGDSSGDWVAKVLYENGFATKPTSQKLNDGFVLKNTFITAAIRCAPPQNKPLTEEFDNCYPFLLKEMSIMNNIKIIICLGKVAYDTCCKLIEIKPPKFYHGKIIHHKKFTIICSYHPSRQNTQTGRLTWKQWTNVFTKAKKILDEIE